MKQKILLWLLPRVVSAILGMLTPELLKKFADHLLDWVEKFVLGTASTIDDRLILPLCNMIREAFNIPDDD